MAVPGAKETVRSKSAATAADEDSELVAPEIKPVPAVTIEDQGWTVHVDPKNDLTYYWHKVKSTSQYQHPWLVQGGTVQWNPTDGSPPCQGMLVSHAYQVRPLKEAIEELAAFKPGTVVKAKRKTWPHNYVVDIALPASDGMAQRLQERIPVGEIKCLAPPKELLADKRRFVAAGWVETVKADATALQAATKADDANADAAAAAAAADAEADSSAASKAVRLVALCPRQHVLQGFVADSAYNCDECSALLTAGTAIFGCRRCDFDLCERCYREPLLQNCPGHHGLKGARTPEDGWRCDRCSKDCKKDTMLYGCRTCDYDLCWKCYVTADTCGTERVRVGDIIERAFVKFSERPCIGYQPTDGAAGAVATGSGAEFSPSWLWLSYGHVFDLMRGIASVLHAYNVKPGRYVGMSGDNSVTYFMVYYALILGGWRPVALSLHLSQENAAHIVQEAELGAVFVAKPTTQARYEQIAASMGAVDAPTTPGSVVEVPEILNCLHLDPSELAEWIASNTEHCTAPPPDASRAAEVSREDLENPLLILYTSGSTGKPKGAVMSERSFLSELKDMVRVDDSDNSGVDLIDAPMATSATPYNIAGTLVTGGRLAIYRDLVRVFDVAAEIGPSTLGLVPQLWAVFYKRFQQDLQEATSGLAADSTEATKAESNLRLEYKLVKLGWRMAGLNCGGATPMPIVQKWLKTIYEGPRCSVTENYASTEAGPITTSYGSNEGVVSDGVEIKLLDWGEYKSTDKPFPRGELLVRSAAMSTGYLNRPDLTASTFDADGYYHTGDVVELVDDGSPKRVRVVDRCKNIFKLVNGEWVSPENVEADLMAKCPSVKQIMVHGTSKHECVVAVVVPARNDDGQVHSKATILAELRAAGSHQTHDVDDASPAATGGGDAAAAGGHDGGSTLRHFEIPQDIVMAAELLAEGGFTPDNGMLTQTNKLCRPAIRRRYKAELDGLLVQQNEALERKKEEQQNKMVEVLRKYVEQIRAQRTEAPSADAATSEITVDEADQAAWNDVEWSSMAATFNHAVIQLHFKGTDRLSVAAVWNGGRGRSILELSTMIVRAQLGDSGSGGGGGGGDAETKGGGSIDWEKECSVVGRLPVPAAVAAGGGSGDDDVEGKADAEDAGNNKGFTSAPLVFMTGCTGFLGAALLAQAVESLSAKHSASGTGVQICCLVRVGKKHTNDMPPPGFGDPDQQVDPAAVARLVASLEAREQMTPLLQTAISGASTTSTPGGVAGGDEQTESPPAVTVTAVRGDLGLPLLGMPEDQFAAIGKRLTCIVHCGSYVNHIFDYSALRAPNADSVVELARLAQASPAPPDFVYVSTISVLDDDETEQSPGRTEYIASAGGYAQSKWVAEMRLRNFAKGQLGGSSPFRSSTIVRPGLLGFDTRSGSANRTDWFMRYLVGCLQIGGMRLPGPEEGGVTGAIHVTAVDHAAAFFAQVWEKRCAVFGGSGSGSGGDDLVPAEVSTLHLPLTINMPTRLFMESFMNSAADNGRRMRVLPASEWAPLIDELPEGNAFWPFRQQFRARGLDGVGAHDFALTTEEYGVQQVTTYDGEMMQSLVGHLLRREPLLRRRLLLRCLSSTAFP